MKKILKVIGIIFILSYLLLFNISEASSEFEYSGVAEMEFSKIEDTTGLQENVDIGKYVNMIFKTVNIVLIGLAVIFIFVGVSFIRNAKKKTGIFFVVIAVIIFFITYIIKILFIHDHEITAA